MKAMVLTAPGELVRDEVARPRRELEQVLVRVTHSGICGTDYKIFNGAIPVRYPRIMGHEMAGEIVDPGASTLRSGDRVIVDPQLYCRACFHCRIGQTHLCRNGMLVGRDTDGGFAEFVAAPPSHVFPLPESVDTRTAPLIQVLTTCLHAQRQVDIFPGEFVVVLGLGVTGQLHVQLAKARGATVIGVTRSADKRELAATLGADITIAGGDGAVERVREATEGRGADVIIETTGVVPSLAAAIDMARSGGRLLLFGIITAKEGALPFYDLYFKELALINARVAKSEDYPAAIGLVQRGHVRLEPLISNVVPLDELKDAIGMLGSDSAQRMKIILEHGT
ncbi:MAG TPA: alcohol dehydrogenase catalytic domain-containing protein [Vicinamibacterales bacterium]|nr:alcohol dehydrogenase catalytic domain-containing protein [Vicinamibacterales bacterium]